MNPNDIESKPLADQGKQTVDKAADVAQDAIRATQRSFNSGLDQASDRLDAAARKLQPTIDEATDAANAATDSVKQLVSDAAAQLRDRAQKASDMAVDYAQAEPVKAMLVAAATGAALMALLRIMVSSRD